MQQLRQPNYSVQGKAGWCLSVQQDVYGTPHLYYSAHDAYNAAQFKHPNEQPPAGIHALCYWTYTEGGIAYWHVATRSTDGRVFSSPFDVAYGNQWFSSIDAMTARIRRIYPACQYVGWCEDLSNVRLVIGDNDMITANDVAPVRVVMSEVEGWNGNDIHAGKADGLIMSAWQGHSWPEFIMHGWTVQTQHRQNLTDTIAGLQAQIAALNTRPTQTQLDALTKAANEAKAQADAATKAAADAQAKLGELETQNTTDTQAADTFLRRLGQFLTKFFK